MTYLHLFFEFFKAGLFSVGGGLATIPFLTDIGARTGWFDSGDLANMIAVSESTPGPLGVNMASYVGYHVGGVPGGVIATVGLICPSVIVILIIAGFLQKFRQSKRVEDVFYGLRPASTGLIAAALLQVCSIALMFHKTALPDQGVVRTELFYWPAVALAAAVFFAMREKHLKKLHPIVFIAFSAVIGILFQM
ncbi:chromate transporter [Pseudoflavonifractor sp. MSJ-37]|uniref:chromate transporter n=1 Tax=Pseudoflavonifractor sp. MSJ-37 TaxID=2841531 RepID=UPI001C0F7F79|nr:chromate transporter [Pseudoflavonifractor sp. MSJ-37]MBU5435834.1 chromate transporter [Pseudoflavonifractor sp. MSJ-37]